MISTPTPSNRFHSQARLLQIIEEVKHGVTTVQYGCSIGDLTLYSCGFVKGMHDFHGYAWVISIGDTGCHFQSWSFCLAHDFLRAAT